MTLKGIQRIFSNCLQLRKVKTSVLSKQCDVMSLIRVAPKLLCLATETRFSETSYLDMIEETGGRIEFSLFGNKRAVKLFDHELLTEQTENNLWSTHRLLLEVNERAIDPRVVNEWSILED